MSGNPQLRLDIPDAMPLLSAGRHFSPTDGACVMEFVSLLAGQGWSDRPRCTHPTLAKVARVINDRLPDGEQTRLVRYAPDMVGLRPRQLQVTPGLVLLCLESRNAAGASAPARRGPARRAARRLAAADRHRHGWWLKITEPLYRAWSDKTVADAIAAVAAAGGEDTTRELVALVGRAVALCKSLQNPSDVRHGRPWPANVPEST